MRNPKPRYFESIFCTVLLATALAGQRSVRFDFGTARARTGGFWNDVTDATSIGVAASDVVTADGRLTSIRLRQLDAWSGVNSDGFEETGVYPNSVTRDSFYLDGSQARRVVRLRLEGLLAARPYELRFFASRLGKDRKRKSVYRVGDDAVALDAADNAGTVVSLKVTAETRGRITIEVERPEGQEFAYLGALEIRGDVPLGEPSREPPERPDGPPVISARGWLIADADSGKVLAGHETAKPLQMASTTKIMTAFVVLTEAQSSPRLLDESVTVTRTADRTGGSTADVRTGERISVRDLLFGLLLPSGNDAAVALAEHVGRRFTSDPQAAPSVALHAFVTHMMQVAKKLGMKATHYFDPHGNSRNRTCALDLLKLTRAALQIEGFRKIVGTRRHATHALRPDGSKRARVFKNSNRLLSIEGYEGVKTGWTRGAGGCLVSLNRHGDRRLLVIVLGSSNRTTRFLDSRNLVRWAYRELL